METTSETRSKQVARALADHAAMVAAEDAVMAYGEAGRRPPAAVRAKQNATLKAWSAHPLDIRSEVLATPRTRTRSGPVW